MTDNSRKRGEPDRSLINVNQDHKLRYWCQTLDVTEDELWTAMAAVGE